MSYIMISLSNLQIELERDLIKRIDLQMENLSDKYEFMETDHLQKEQLLYSLLNNAINLDEHYAVKYLINQVKVNLGIDFSIQFYLFQSKVFNIKCLPLDDEESPRLAIFVSQHFFNNLVEDEQAGIIGHEIAHYVFKHTHIPIMQIMNCSFDNDEGVELRSNLLAWSKAKELTADMVGLVANGFNVKAYSTAIIKHHTGLHDGAISRFNIAPVVDLVLKQYDQMADNPLYYGEISTHPMTPLRVRIVNSIANLQIIRNFNSEVSDRKLKEFEIEYNSLINKMIMGVYPDMILDANYSHQLLDNLYIAIILADGNIDEREIMMLSRLMDSEKQQKLYLKLIEIHRDSKLLISFSSKLISESVIEARTNSLTQHDIAALIRKLLLMAASDGEVVTAELEVIYQFAKVFGFTRKDIVIIMQTLNVID